MVKDQDQSDVLLWSALVTAVIVHSWSLFSGIVQQHWSVARSIWFIGLALGYIVVVALPCSNTRFGNWIIAIRYNQRLFLALAFGFATALQITSATLMLQPVAFMIPMVYVAEVLPLRRTLIVAFGVVGLMVLSVLASGFELTSNVIGLLGGHVALLSFITLFGYMSVQAIQARSHATALAHQLAAERDYLHVLVDATAMLPRAMHVHDITQHIADAGMVLTQAQAARVWLLEDTTWNSAAHSGVWQDQAATIVTLPFVAQSSTIGRLELLEPKTTGADQRKFQPFIDAATLAIVNARLYEQAHVSATLAERNRLARDFHDTIAQHLTALRMQLEAGLRLIGSNPERATQRIERANQLALEALRDVRRSVWDLSAPVIDGRALSENIASQVAQFHQRTAIAAEYAHEGDTPTINSTTASQLLRIVGEALTNIEKHAYATHVTVRSNFVDGVLSIVVLDNGVGFDVTQPTARDGGGFGLSSLQERARLAGATVAISSEPQAGTRIIVSVPVAAPLEATAATVQPQQRDHL